MPLVKLGPASAGSSPLSNDRHEEQSRRSPRILAGQKEKWQNDLCTEINTDPALNASRILTDFKVGGLQRGAGEETRKHHVDGDGEAAAHVSFGDLDVLDLGGVSGVSLRAA